MLSESASRILARHAAVSSRLTEIDAEREALRAEYGELDIAIRVLRRFDAPGSPPVSEAFPPSLAIVPTGEHPQTVPAMILAALKSATSSGITPSEAIEFIRAQYRPDVDPNHVRPAIWRMWKDNRVAKDGDRYYHLNFAPDGAERIGALNGHAASAPVSGSVQLPLQSQPGSTA